MRQEEAAGLNYLKKSVGRSSVNIGEISPLQNREAYELEFWRNSQRHTIVLTSEFLSDLPSTAHYQESTQAYIEILQNRMLNVSVSEFYCIAGSPLHVQIEWPTNAIPGLAAFYVRVRVQDLRIEDKEAICPVRMSHQQLIFDLRGDPSLRRRP